MCIRDSGTDIILGGNPEFLARREMRRLKYEDERIEDAVSHADTQDEEILKAREKYQELYDKFNKVCQEEHAKVVEAGGLHIIGTERHESRRIDNQLRGRAGRQGCLLYTSSCAIFVKNTTFSLGKGRLRS